jgi:hypothetical protein
MTPAERVVVEAAVRWARSRTVLQDSIRLQEAVEALQAERTDPSAPQEQDLTWGQVVEGDEIYSAKTNRWYEVTAASHRPPASTINAKGIPKALHPKSADPVRIRRGGTGLAVDMFASVLWSGQSRAEER